MRRVGLRIFGGTREIDGRVCEAYDYIGRQRGSLSCFGWLVGNRGGRRTEHVEIARLAEMGVDHAEYLVRDDGLRMLVGHIYDLRYRKELLRACETFGLQLIERKDIAVSWRDGLRIEIIVSADGPPYQTGLRILRGRP